MEMMLTGDAFRHRSGACRVCQPRFPAATLDPKCWVAVRIAKPTDVQQMNKRSVHRAMEIMGMRAAIRAGTEIKSGATRKLRTTFAKFRESVTKALDLRDGDFGDYRTGKAKNQRKKSKEGDAMNFTGSLEDRMAIRETIEAYADAVSAAMRKIGLKTGPMTACGIQGMEVAGKDKSPNCGTARWRDFPLSRSLVQTGAIHVIRIRPPPAAIRWKILQADGKSAMSLAV